MTKLDIVTTHSKAMTNAQANTNSNDFYSGKPTDQTELGMHTPTNQKVWLKFHYSNLITATSSKI